MAGNVKEPVEATLADAEPEMEPNREDASTDTLAAPALRRPAEANARFMNPCPASPAFSTAPKITNTATTDTDTPVSCPHKPPSAMTSVPRKALHRQPRMTKFAGYVLSNSPYTSGKHGNQRQRPADRPARHLDDARQHHQRCRDLQVALQRAVLVIQRAMRRGQPDANRNAASTERPSKPARNQPALVWRT
jgi:hypothetical protein